VAWKVRPQVWPSRASVMGERLEAGHDPQDRSSSDHLGDAEAHLMTTMARKPS